MITSYKESAWIGDGKNSRFCKGCVPTADRIEATTRISQEHPTWSVARIKARAWIEAMKKPVPGFSV